MFVRVSFSAMRMLMGMSVGMLMLVGMLVLVFSFHIASEECLDAGPFLPDTAFFVDVR